MNIFKTLFGITRLFTLVSACALGIAPLMAADKDSPDKDSETKTNSSRGGYFNAESVTNAGSVTVEGNAIAYDAVAGTLVVHPKGWDDALPPELKETPEGKDNPTAEASMFYVAYLKQNASAVKRPVTFLYNGGPGSSTVWLHMGAFGPRRVVTADDSHTPAAPYDVVNNDFSILDASDLVFIDAPGTGFSRVAGKDKEKSFYGIDADAHAFAEFICAFLSKYGRWNSPKFVFGESYGTPRSAVLLNLLETDYGVDFNGAILLSQILNFDLSADGPEDNPGVEIPYVLALPTYAATAWYHHKLPGPNPPATWSHFSGKSKGLRCTTTLRRWSRGLPCPKPIELHRREASPIHRSAVELYSQSQFAHRRRRVREKPSGRYRQHHRTAGHAIFGAQHGPLSKEADYDPQSAAISSAYISAFNDYVRTTLHYGYDKTYRPDTDLWKTWDFKHAPPNRSDSVLAVNTMPDLASAMKYNPNLKILLAGGYFDLATPYCEGRYEMQHLQMPTNLQTNIQYHYYQSGHMVYAHQECLKQMHDDVVAFIKTTDNLHP